MIVVWNAFTPCVNIVTLWTIRAILFRIFRRGQPPRQVQWGSITNVGRNGATTAQKMSKGCVDAAGIKENMKVGQHPSLDITEGHQAKTSTVIGRCAILGSILLLTGMLTLIVDIILSFRASFWGGGKGGEGEANSFASIDQQIMF